MTGVRTIFLQSITTRTDRITRDLGALARFADRLIKMLRARRHARISARELRRLDPKLLADIGYQPTDIDPVARVLAGRAIAAPANDNHEHFSAAG